VINVNHPQIMEPGIYFGFPEDLYHQAFALSASGIKSMRISTLNYWVDSALNPAREQRDTSALREGKAYHKRIIEGKSAFDALFAPALDPADHPDALRTNEQLVAALDSFGIRVPKTTRKDDLIAKLADVDPAAKIWALIERRHQERYPGREFLSAEVVRRIEVAAAMIENHPQLSKAFTGGMGEVSVFWTDPESGVPFKCRFDYLKPIAVVDLKSMANINGIPIKRAIALAVAAHSYHIQAALYLRGAEQARRLAREGRVSGEVDRGFVKGLVDMTAPFTFLFVFQQKGPAPVARGRVMREGSALDIGRIEIAEATQKFIRCWESFGADPWVDIEDIDSFDDLEFPAYLAAA
jgi:hypothetical protein